MRTVVWGAPCSGKTTYVREHVKAGDVICDYDAIYQALSGLPNQQRVETLDGFVVEAVENVHNLIFAHTELDAWIITASREKAKAEELAKRFDAELVALEVSREEAHKRCDADGRPACWHEFIDRWFETTTKGSNQMEKKLFDIALEFKADADQTGQFQAVFSWFNVIDKQGDLTIPGAFEDGAKVKIAYWGHRWENLPVGRGVIHQDQEKAWVDGKFFLDTEAGLETYKTVKNLGELQEWSYGFETLDSSEDTRNEEKIRILKKLKTFEISPVFLGAGFNTQTLAIKSEGKLPPHTEEPEVEPKSEAVENGNESKVDPADFKLYIEIVELETKHERQ